MLTNTSLCLQHGLPEGVSLGEELGPKHWAIQLVKHIFNCLLTLSIIHRKDADEYKPMLATKQRQKAFAKRISLFLL
jgi:hypothetical protein